MFNNYDDVDFDAGFDACFNDGFDADFNTSFDADFDTGFDAGFDGLVFTIYFRSKNYIKNSE